MNAQKPSRARVVVDAQNGITHLAPPEYHGSPIDARGSLVTMDWGFDIRDHISAACGLQTEIITMDDLSRGIRAEYIEVLLTTKPRQSAPGLSGNSTT